MRPKTVLETPAPAPMGPNTGQPTRAAPEFPQTVPPAESEYSWYCSESVPLDMKRLPPAAWVPRSSPTVTPAEPLVHSTLTEVFTSSAVVLFATTGSYAPKLRSVAKMAQLADTVLVTLKVVVLLPATAAWAVKRSAAAAAARVRMRVFTILLLGRW